jgi:glutathione S-transferase
MRVPMTKSAHTTGPIEHSTLYHYPLSRSVRVRMLLIELGLPHELVRVDLQTLFESGAMILHLADLYPDAGLAPSVTDPMARADYLQMVAFNTSQIDTILWNIRLHQDLFPKPVRSQATVEFNTSKLQNEIIPQLEARLSQQDWICGDMFTAADCIMAQNVGWMRAYGVGHKGAVHEYAKRLQARPSWQTAYSDASEFER